MSNHQPTIDNHLRDVLQPGDRVSPATVRWLRNGIEQHMQTSKPLHQCLDIGRAAYLIAQRDKYLVNAWQIVDQNATPWGRCLLLTNEISNFKTSVWYQYEDQDKPDPDWSDLRKNIFFAFRYSIGLYNMPSTPNRIKDIVKSAGSYAS